MSLNLDVDLLKTFIAIADTGSFSRAAEEVNKTQSAVSMQMKRLEEIVTKPLFVKQGRVNRLTSDGEQLLDYGRRIIRIADEAMQNFTEPECCGHVSLGTPDDYADRLLPEVLARFSRTHPHVEVKVECMGSHTLAGKVQRGELDLSIVTCEDKLTQLPIEHLRTEPLLWVTSPRHCTHEKDVLPIAALNTDCYWRQLSLEALDKTDIDYRVAYTSSSCLGVAAAVQAGLAVAAMPDLVMRPGMRILKPKDGFPELPDINIGMINKPGELSAPELALANHIRESFSNVSGMLVAAE